MKNKKANGEAPRYIYEYEGMTADQIKASQEEAKAKRLKTSYPDPFTT